MPTLSATASGVLLTACAAPTRPPAAAGSGAADKAPVDATTTPGNGAMSPAAAPGRGAGSPAARRPVIGLALGGGAARGFAHVGVIAALERAGIQPSIVAGTSAGSLVGALYASGMNAARLKTTALALEEGALGDWSFNARGLLRGQALQDMVNRLLASRPIEAFPRTFAAAATDLYNGQPVLLRRGDPGRAVRASSAVPGLFQPVEIDGREYVDGGLSSPVPVRLARQLGARFVIAVDISARPKFQETDTMARVLLQTFAIMGQRIAAVELAEAELVVAPAIGDLSGADFDSRRLAIEEGERAMDRLMPELLRRLALSSSRPD